MCVLFLFSEETGVSHLKDASLKVRFLHTHPTKDNLNLVTKQ